MRVSVLPLQDEFIFTERNTAGLVNAATRSTASEVSPIGSTTVYFSKLTYYGSVVEHADRFLDARCVSYPIVPSITCQTMIRP